MKIASSLVVFLGLMPSFATAQMSLQIDPRGAINEVRVGDTAYLTDLAVSVVKPGWSGNLADQRAVDPASVHVRKDGPTTTYSMPLAGGPLAGQLIERVTQDGDLVTLHYEVIPDEEIEIEAILLQGLLPADRHAGKTSYFVGDRSGTLGLLAAELDEKKHIIWSGDPEWFGLGAGEGGLRLLPQAMGLQLQDNRKWNTPAFGLLATAGGGEHLARKPIQFSLVLRADTSERLARDAKQDTQAGDAR